jgi:hypothetical protein
MRVAIAAAVLAALGAQEPSTADQAVAHVLQRLHPDVTHPRIWRRQPIDGGLDVVFVEGYRRKQRSRRTHRLAMTL